MEQRTWQGYDMNKKVIIYFASATIMISSAAAYLILKEIQISENTYTLTGTYDLWESGSSGSYADPVSNDKTAETEKITEDNSSEVYIDINTASEGDLMKLKGIGKTIAGNIISYRQSEGGFGSIEEIINVKGIGEKKFLAIKEHIYVNNNNYTEPETEVQTTAAYETASDNEAGQ